MSELSLTLGLAGKVGDFSLEQAEYNYSVSDQTAANGPKSFEVPPNTVLGTFSRCLDPMSAQSILLILAGASGASATVRINGTPLELEVKPSSFLVLPGGPVTATLEFANSDTTKAADITVLQLGLAGNLPGGGVIGGNYQFEDVGPAGVGQTDFPLGATPAAPDKLLFFLDGVEYNAGADAEVTVVTTGGDAPKVVWSGAALAGGERVHVVY